MKSRKIFWGIILVFFGTILLLENFNVINFEWSQIWRFWPVILILIGINSVTAKTNPKIGIPIVAFFTILILGLLAFKGLQHNNVKHQNFFEFFNDDKDDNEDMDSLQSDSSATNKYTEEYDTRYKFATLIIKGAAGTFDISNSTNQLFDAEVKDSFKKFMVKKTESDTSATIELNNSKTNNNTFKSNRLSDVNMSLNVNPIWDLEANIGAGQLNLDLSNFKVRNVTLKGGAAAFDITLGSKFNNATLNAETGVASVKVKIPKSVGCHLNVKSGLSTKNFEGFTNLANGDYETPGFAKSATKVYINFKGGVSSFEVKRY
jgi:hypothetical protein